MAMAAAPPQPKNMFVPSIPVFPQGQPDSHFLKIPPIPTPTSGSFPQSNEYHKSRISQANSAPATPTNSSPQPPRRGKGDGKPSNSKGNSNLAHVPCKFFKNGSCTAGKNCHFSHDISSEQHLCKYYMKGNCKYGSKCALSHDLRNVNNNNNKIQNQRPIPEIRSSGTPPQGYAHDQAEFPPASSPGGQFSRVQLNSMPDYTNNRQYSQLTEALQGQTYHVGAQDRLLSPTTYNGHLTPPPIQIRHHRGSLPNIYHHDQFDYGGGFDNNNLKPGPPPTVYGSENGLMSPTGTLPSIPENQNHDDDGNFGSKGSFLPSFMNDLLTPDEIEEKRSEGFQEKSTMGQLFEGRTLFPPFPVSNNLDPSHIHPGSGKSLPHGVSEGLVDYYHGPNMGPPPYGYPDCWSVNVNQHNNLHPQPIQQPRPASYNANFMNDPQYFNNHHPSAINITAASPRAHVDHNSPMSQTMDYKIDSQTSPPFSPSFEDDTPFVMDDERNDQTEVQKAPETQHTYSTVTKAGLKDSGATPGTPGLFVSLCPFGVAGNDRYNDHYYSHGLPCSSCHEPVLHPCHTQEEHRKEHINEWINHRQEQPDSNGIRQEDIECGICCEKVLSKEGARFGLLNCEHAFCLRCIRQWRSNAVVNNQVVRECPVCRTQTYFITPSITFITDPQEKQRLTEAYVRRCSGIPCKHYIATGSCQFGSSCLYAHTKEQANIRTIQNDDEEVRVLNDVKLSDFMGCLALVATDHGEAQQQDGKNSSV